MMANGLPTNGTCWLILSSPCMHADTLILLSQNYQNLGMLKTMHGHQG